MTTVPSAVHPAILSFLFSFFLRAGAGRPAMQALPLAHAADLPSSLLWNRKLEGGGAPKGMSLGPIPGPSESPALHLFFFF